VRRKTIDAARGKWRGVLMSLGLDERFMTGKHGPCPMCGGTDRFRWDNQHGNGGFICNKCGAGNGFDLLMGVHGWDFPTAAREVDAIVGNVEVEATRRQVDEGVQRRLLNDLWQGAIPLVLGDPAFRYLSSRGPIPPTLPNCLRYTPRCPSPDGVFRPALLAMVMSSENEPLSIHRTFLGPNGKADMDDPRAMMPGKLKDGAAVRLSAVHGERLGIAEGIETAFAAAHRFNVPVWSAINSTMLEKWAPPSTVQEVLIFGDNDPKFGGQAAAYRLASKLAGRMGLRVQVHIPPEVGCDWADIVQAQREPA
jgi:putative DNA primase/helicase